MGSRTGSKTSKACWLGSQISLNCAVSWSVGPLSCHCRWAKLLVGISTWVLLGVGTRHARPECWKSAVSPTSFLHHYLTSMVKTPRFHSFQIPVKQDPSEPLGEKPPVLGVLQLLFPRWGIRRPGGHRDSPGMRQGGQSAAAPLTLLTPSCSASEVQGGVSDALQVLEFSQVCLVFR